MAENTEMKQRIRVLENTLNQNTNFSFNFREIQDTITPFSGESNEDVDCWIVDMENTAVALGWSSQQLFIYGKNNLKGTARLAMSGRIQITNWMTLKKCLKEEFQREISMMEIHQMMIGRRWRKDETLLHYYYDMLKLGEKGVLSDADVIRYIIEGIQDTPFNKAVLYGCNGLSEFKKKLEMYQQIRTEASRYKYRGNVGGSKERQDKEMMTEEEKPVVDVKTFHCYQCGDKTHLRKDCPKGVKCFSCNDLGHIPTNCPKNTNQSVAVAMKNANRTKRYKVISINEMAIDALVDTGSDINIVPVSVASRLNIRKINPTDVMVNGVGSRNVQSEGVAQVNIKIVGDFFTTKVYVFQDGVIPADFVIGNELLDTAEVIIKNGGIEIKKSGEKTHEVENLVKKMTTETDRLKKANDELTAMREEKAQIIKENRCYREEFKVLTKEMKRLSEEVKTMKQEMGKEKLKNVKKDEKIRKVRDVQESLVDDVDRHDEINDRQRRKLFDGSITNQQKYSYAANEKVRDKSSTVENKKEAGEEDNVNFRSKKCSSGNEDVKFQGSDKKEGCYRKETGMRHKNRSKRTSTSVACMSRYLQDSSSSAEDGSRGESQF